MSTYRVSTGHDVALGSLTVLSPQPSSAGLQYAAEEYGADGTVNRQGAYVELRYELLADKSEYQTILTNFGLLNAASAAVTVYVRDENYDWARMNGTAIKPPANWERFFPRSITILVRNLEDAA